MDMAHDPAFGALTPPGSTRERWGGVDAAEWAELAGDVADPNCFYAPELLIPAIKHLAQPGEVRMIAARADGRLIGLLPVTVRDRHGRLPIANVANWMHAHCFYGAPLLRRGHEAAAWADILGQLDAASWAPGFLHLSNLDAAGAAAVGLEAACFGQQRMLREIHRHDRAMLRSDASADAYWEANVRSKKRKEIRRLQKRLGEMGAVQTHTLDDGAMLQGWCDDFLTLEAAGWKGANGSALRCSDSDSAFLRAALVAAWRADRLIFLRLDLDDKPIAMLINFVAMDGSFSFKIAFDEDLARFSPGVLIEIENLRVVQEHASVAWMDSCAAPDHPMIDSLWAERRSIAQYRVALKGGWRRKAALVAANGIESLAARMKKEEPA